MKHKLCKFIKDPRLGTCPLGTKNCPFEHKRSRWEKKYGSGASPEAKAKAKAKAKARAKAMNNKGKGKGKGRAGAAETVADEDGGEDGEDDGWGTGVSFWSYRNSGPMKVVYDIDITPSLPTEAPAPPKPKQSSGDASPADAGTDSNRRSLVSGGNKPATEVERGGSGQCPKITKVSDIPKRFWKQVRSRNDGTQFYTKVEIGAKTVVANETLMLDGGSGVNSIP